jgi:glycine cleavage system H protein
MAQVQGFDFPEDRFYDIENQIWYMPLPDGTLRAGFTAWAVKLMGEVLVFTPKRLGQTFDKDKWFAMVEGGKWIGAARAAFDGTVVTQNEALIDRPELLMKDAFGAGWMITLKPASAAWQSLLTPGEGIAATVEAWIAGGSYKER